LSGVFLPFTDFSAEGGFNCWWIRLQMHHFSMGNSQKTLKLVTELAKHPGCCPNLAEVCFQLRTTGDLLFYLVCHLDTFLLPLKKDGFIHFRELEWKTIRYSLHCSSSISRIKLILSIQRLEILLSVDCKECKVLPFVVSLVLCFHPVKKKCPIDSAQGKFPSYCHGLRSMENLVSMLLFSQDDLIFVMVLHSLFCPGEVFWWSIYFKGISCDINEGNVIST